MNNLPRTNPPHPCHPSQRQGVWRRSGLKLLLLPVASLVLACASCSCSGSGSRPSPVPVTDTTPVGDGLTVIGFALLGAAVVSVLGKLMK